MLHPGMYVCSELVKVGKASAEVAVFQSGAMYEALWECSCGAKQESPATGLTIASAAENSKANYREHCTAAHQE
jgi:hypothetical protein